MADIVNPVTSGPLGTTPPPAYSGVVRDENGNVVLDQNGQPAIETSSTGTYAGYTGQVNKAAKGHPYLNYKHEYEKNNPKSDYVKNYLNTPFAQALGNDENNYPERLDNEYEANKNKYIAQQVFKNNPIRKGESRGEYLDRLAQYVDETGAARVSHPLENILDQYKNQSKDTKENLWHKSMEGIKHFAINAFDDRAHQLMIRHIANDKNLSRKEKEEALLKYANPSVLSAMASDAADILSPIMIPYNATTGAAYTTAEGEQGYTPLSGLSGDMPANQAPAEYQIMADPLNLLFPLSEGLEVGSKVGRALGTEEGLLSNAHKYNPWAFKPDSEAYYRMIGSEGMQDAMQSGVIRANQNNLVPYEGMTQPLHDAPYFSKGKPWDKSYTGPYMIEAKNIPMEGRPAYPETAYVPESNIMSSDPNLKFYKQDWLQGYKPVNVESKVASRTEKTVEEMVNAARNGDIEAQQKLSQYGLDWDEKPTKYRQVGEEEIDKLFNGETVLPARNGSYLDVSDHPFYWGKENDNFKYHVTFKDEPHFDTQLTGDVRTITKNKEQGEYGIRDGYSLNDVAKIEKMNERTGEWETIYNGVETLPKSTPTNNLMGKIVNRSITPIGYDPFTVAAAPIELATPKFLKFKPQTYATKNRYDAWRLYNGLPPEFNTFSKNADGTLALNDFRIDKNKLEKIVNYPKSSFGTMEIKKQLNFGGVHGNGWITKGIDEQGRKFIDFTDTWDLHPFRTIKGLPKKLKEFEVSSLTGGKPFDLKNRIYYDDAGNFFDHNHNQLIEEIQHFPKGVVKQHEEAYVPMLSTPNVAGTKQMDVLRDWDKAVNQKFMKGTGTAMGTIFTGIGLFTHYEQEKLKKQRELEKKHKSVPTKTVPSILQNYQGLKQHEDGGYLDMGGVPPLYVTSVNDPRYQAYKDSAYLYNNSIQSAINLKKMMSANPSGVIKLSPSNQAANDAYKRGQQILRYNKGRNYIGNTIRPVNFESYSILNNDAFTKALPIYNDSYIDPNPQDQGAVMTGLIPMYPRPKRQVIVTPPIQNTPGRQVARQTTRLLNPVPVATVKQPVTTQVPHITTMRPLIVPAGDPRLQSYQDSLVLHNSTGQILNALHEWNKNPTEENRQKYFKAQDLNVGENLHGTNKWSKHAPTNLHTPMWTRENAPDGDPDWYYTYKKPVQKVFVQGSIEAENSVHQQELADAGYNITVDGVWGPESQKAWDDYAKRNPKSMVLTTTPSAYPEQKVNQNSQEDKSKQQTPPTPVKQTVPPEPKPTFPAGATIVPDGSLVGGWSPETKKQKGLRTTKEKYKNQDGVLRTRQTIYDSKGNVLETKEDLPGNYRKGGLVKKYSLKNKNK